MKFSSIISALESLVPGAQWSLSGDSIEGLIWLDDNVSRPTDEQLINECNRQEIIFEKMEYQRLRQSEYPNLADFADAYYWAQEGDNSKMDEYLAKIKEVKNKYPKVPDAS